MEERYCVLQEISRNSDVRLATGATGGIEILVPYDGRDHFTRTALDDVKHWVARNGSAPEGDSGSEPVDAQIGHLVVADHEHTNLAEVVDRSGRTMAVPLQIPVRCTELATDDDLVTDRHRFRTTIAYRPAADRPVIIPVKLEVEVDDPGSVSVPHIDPKDQSKLPDAAEVSQQYMTFRPYLELRIRVRVILPTRKGTDPPAPVVRRLSLSLPSGLVLAPSSIGLEIQPDEPAPRTEADDDTAPPPPVIQYDPRTASIGWFDIHTEPTKKNRQEGPRAFRSPLMVVHVNEPGELFAEPELVVRAEVETPDTLLSDAQYRLFDARGQESRGARSPLTVRSLITVETTVVLGDAFAQRKFEPQQSFHFDEVIPAPLRVEDIASALTDLRFEVRQPKWKAKRTKSFTLVGYIEARRGEAGNTMRMRLFVIGRHQRTQRQSQHPGGRRYTSKLDTGDLTLIVHGEVPRDSSELIHQMNELQMTLRDRFRRLKAQR